MLSFKQIEKCRAQRKAAAPTLLIPDSINIFLQLLFFEATDVITTTATAYYICYQ